MTDVLAGSKEFAHLMEWAASITLDDIDGPTRSNLMAILADTLGNAVAGGQTPEATIVSETAESALAGAFPRTSSVLGGSTNSMAAAVVINAYRITALTMCDVFHPTLAHLTPEVVPPALAIAEYEEISGTDVLAGVAVGLEVAARIGKALNYTEFRRKGWHSPGVSGAMGAAAGVARCLGLGPEDVANAVALAGSQAAGTFASYGSAVIKVHQARGALSALLSAVLTTRRFRGSETILNATDGGLATTYSKSPEWHHLTADLGEAWELSDITLRRWPVSALIQPMLTGIFETREQSTVDVDQIAEVQIGLPVDAFRLHGEMDWVSEFRAHLSAPYVASVALLTGRCWMDSFDPQMRADPLLNQLAEKLLIAPSDDLPAGSASIHIRLVGGEELSRTTTDALGTPGRRFSEDDLRSKYEDCLIYAGMESQVDESWELMWSLPQATSVRPLLRALRRSSKR